MVKAKYEAQLAKLDNLAEKHNLICTWDTEAKHITLTARPQALETEQTSFIEEAEDEKSSGDAALSIIFKDGEIKVSAVGKLFISEALINKLKNIAKKLHYLYLQMLHEEMIRGGYDTPTPDFPEYEDCEEWPKPDDFDEEE